MKKVTALFKLLVAMVCLVLVAAIAAACGDVDGDMSSEGGSYTYNGSGGSDASGGNTSGTSYYGDTMSGPPSTPTPPDITSAPASP